MPTLTYQNVDGTVIDLNQFGELFLNSLRGAGLPPVNIQTAKTPLQDGETYVRTLLEARFLTLVLTLIGSSRADIATKRRNLMSVLNPKLGVGTLKWNSGNGTLYAIDCILATGLKFNNHSSTQARIIASMRCPDPAWYLPTANVPTVIVPDVGLSVPITIPLSIVDNTTIEVINNIGDLASPVIITATGPFADSKITNTTTGVKMQFTGLDVLSGEVLTIDTGLRTADVDGINVMSKLTADSGQLLLEPGNNSVEVVTGEGGAIFTFTYFTRFLGV